MAVRSMSDKELARLEVLRDLDSQRLTAATAAQLLGAKPPANAKDLHRPMGPRDRLEDAFSWQVERTLSQSLTLQYDKVLFILDPTEAAQAAIGKRVTVADYPDGRLVISYQGCPLSYRTFDKIRKVNQAAVVENKRLGPLLEMIKLYQDAQPQAERSRKGPKRRDQSGHMFSVG